MRMPGVTDLVCLRHSTDKQTDARQRPALTALPRAGAPVYEDPAISSRQRSLDRASSLLHEAAIGDAARLFRSVATACTSASNPDCCPGSTWPTTTPAPNWRSPS